MAGTPAETPPPQGAWSEIRLGGHLVDLFEPGQPHEPGLTLLYLHGVNLARLNQNAVFTGLFNRHGLRVAAPMTGRSWWTDRPCDEFDPALSAERFLLVHVLPDLQARWGAAAGQIALLGASMGGQGALRLAFKHPRLFPVVAALAPAIDFQKKIEERDPVLSRMYDFDPEAARQETALLAIHALNYPRHIWFCCDPADSRWYESSEKLRMKLAALGIPHECDLETMAGGHSFAYYNRMAPAAVAFVAERLKRERLRMA